MPRPWSAWDRRLPPMLILLAACWLLAHPWLGLWHDGRLYAAQALHRLYPENFQNDLFFRYGSQDSFSLFSPIYAAAIDALGLPAAALLMYGAGSLLWLAAAGWLLRPLLQGWAFWLGFALLLLLPADYGPAQGLLNLAEPFPTPRIFAEGLSMLALAGLLRGSVRWSVPALALAFLVHPLMAAAAALLGLLYLAKGRERSTALCAALAAGALLALAVLGVGPFGRLLVAMDSEWLALVSRYAFVHTWDTWPAAQWVGRTAVAFSLVGAAACLAQGAPARFYGCLAATAALGLLAAWIGTGLWHNLLLIQVQPWRTLWLLQLGASLALAWLLATYWQRGGVIRVLLLALAVATLTRNTIGGALAVPAAILLCLQLRRPVPSVLPGRSGWLSAALVLALGSLWLAEIVQHATDNGALMAALIEETPTRIWGWALLKKGAFGVLGAAVAWLVWRLAGSCRRGAGLLAWLVALASLGLGATLRPGPQDYAYPMSDQARRDIQAVLRPLIPATALVYWERDVRVPWFVLHRSSYASNAQLAGMAFNRGTAVEGVRRLQRLQQLGVPDSVREYDAAGAKQKIAGLPPPSLQGLQYVCGDPALDFVVLSARLGAGRVAEVIDRAFGTPYYLYDCGLVRTYNPQLPINSR